MIDNLPAWLAVAIACVSLLYTILSNQSKKTAAKVKSLETEVKLKADATEVTVIAEKVDELETRATKIEGEIKHLPDKDMAHDLAMAVGELKGKVDVLTERLQPVTAMASRIQEALIEKVTAQ